MAKEIYYSMDKTKFIVKKKKVWTDEITYIWEAYYCKDQTQYNNWYSSSADTANPIRRIKKMIEDEDWNIEVFYPDGDTAQRFVRDDRETLNYI